MLVDNYGTYAKRYGYDTSEYDFHTSVMYDVQHPVTPAHIVCEFREGVLNVFDEEGDTSRLWQLIDRCFFRINHLGKRTTNAIAITPVEDVDISAKAIGALTMICLGVTTGVREDRGYLYALNDYQELVGLLEYEESNNTFNITKLCAIAGCGSYMLNVLATKGQVQTMRDQQLANDFFLKNGFKLIDDRYVRRCN